MSTYKFNDNSEGGRLFQEVVFKKIQELLNQELTDPAIAQYTVALVGRGADKVRVEQSLSAVLGAEYSGQLTEWLFRELRLNKDLYIKPENQPAPKKIDIDVEPARSTQIHEEASALKQVTKAQEEAAVDLQEQDGAHPLLVDEGDDIGYINSLSEPEDGEKVSPTAKAVQSAVVVETHEKVTDPVIQNTRVQLHSPERNGTEDKGAPKKRKEEIRWNSWKEEKVADAEKATATAADVHKEEKAHKDVITYKELKSSHEPQSSRHHIHPESNLRDEIRHSRNLTASELPESKRSVSRERSPDVQRGASKSGRDDKHTRQRSPDHNNLAKKERRGHSDEQPEPHRHSKSTKPERRSRTSPDTQQPLTEAAAPGAVNIFRRHIGIPLARAPKEIRIPVTQRLSGMANEAEETQAGPSTKKDKKKGSHSSRHSADGSDAMNSSQRAERTGKPSSSEQKKSKRSVFDRISKPENSSQRKPESDGIAELYDIEPRSTMDPTSKVARTDGQPWPSANHMPTPPAPPPPPRKLKSAVSIDNSSHKPSPPAAHQPIRRPGVPEPPARAMAAAQAAAAAAATALKGEMTVGDVRGRMRQQQPMASTSFPMPLVGPGLVAVVNGSTPMSEEDEKRRLREELKRKALELEQLRSLPSRPTTAAAGSVPSKPSTSAPGVPHTWPAYPVHSHALRDDDNASTACSIVVSNITPKATKELLEAHFRKCGEIERIMILQDPASLAAGGRAYIQFKNEISALKAIADLHRSDFLNQKIVVEEKQSYSAAQSLRYTQQAWPMPMGKMQGHTPKPAPGALPAAQAFQPVPPVRPIVSKTWVRPTESDPSKTGGPATFHPTAGAKAAV